MSLRLGWSYPILYQEEFPPSKTAYYVAGLLVPTAAAPRFERQRRGAEELLRCIFDEGYYRAWRRRQGGREHG